MGPKTTSAVNNEKTGHDYYYSSIFSSTTRNNNNKLDPALIPTQSDIDIVRTSWERVVNLSQPKDPASVSPAQGFGLAFYDALFDLDPQVRSLFGTNVLVQAKMLTYVIAYIARAPLIATTTTTSLDLPEDHRQQHYHHRHQRQEPRSRKSSSSSSSSSSTPPPPPPCKMYTIKEINARKRKKQQQQQHNNNDDDNDDDDEEDLDPEWLVMKLRELGARHHYYKVEPEQFQLVGPAIDTALRVRLEDEYTVEIGKAWTRTHAYVAHHMALGLVSQRQWEKKKKSSSSLLHRSSSSSSSNCSLQ